ncbi:MAG: NADPH:quinone reductase [Marmoricola sp.]|nr:NADPH:quinone reductase [Marmoricola sp.]
MKAVRFHEFGEAAVLRVEDVEDPTPGPGEVLVRVAATSFNGVDAGIRGGWLQGPFPVALPHTPGVDVAGTVSALGAGVTLFEVGQPVVGFLPMVPDGAAAELVVAPAEVLAAAPVAVPLTDAAALPLVGLTAWQALTEHAQVEAGQRVLVVGASGGVGAYAVQLAHHLGAHVTATASARHADRVRDLGADEVVDHTRVDVATAVAGPVDVVLNLAPTDPATLAALAGLVRPGGALVNTVVAVDPPTAEGMRAVNVFVRSDADQLAHLVSLVDGGDLRIEVADRVPLADLAALHARADDGGLPGKTVVVVG